MPRQIKLMLLAQVAPTLALPAPGREIGIQIAVGLLRRDELAHAILQGARHFPVRIGQAEPRRRLHPFINIGVVEKNAREGALAPARGDAEVFDPRSGDHLPVFFHQHPAQILPAERGPERPGRFPTVHRSELDLRMRADRGVEKERSDG